MSRWLALIRALALTCGVSARLAHADGEVPCWSGRAGGYQVAVFQGPSTLRVGPAHYSLFVQDGATGAWLPTARAMLRCAPRDMPRQIQAATFDAGASDNRLLHAATVDLTQPGWWDFEIAIAGPLGEGELQLAAEVLPPAPRWQTFWPWFSWPAVPIVLFAAHQRLAAKARRGGQPAQ
jgi:hypothetical protein